MTLDIPKGLSFLGDGCKDNNSISIQIDGN